jgi:hypothetical protein
MRDAYVNMRHFQGNFKEACSSLSSSSVASYPKPSQQPESKPTTRAIRFIHHPYCMSAQAQALSSNNAVLHNLCSGCTTCSDTFFLV